MPKDIPLQEVRTKRAKRTKVDVNSSAEGGGSSNLTISTWEDDLANNLPSKYAGKVGYAGTIRFQNDITGRKERKRIQFTTSNEEELETNDIVDNLLKTPSFHKGTVQTENIKGLHTNLTRKLSIQAKLRKNDAKPSQPMGDSTWAQCARKSLAQLLKQTKVGVAEVSYSTDVWRGDLKKIEGKFGSGVASYFTFMVWLIKLNIPVFILLFSFITIPQLLDPSNKDSDHEAFSGMEILTGEGWFSDSELYYGSHSNEIIRKIKDLPYDMPKAYLLTIMAYYAITTIALLYSLTKSYKKNFIDSASMSNFQSVSKVLCGWDFAITKAEAAALKQQSIYKELQEYLAVFRSSKVKMSMLEKYCVTLSRIIVNLVCIMLIIGAGYLIRYVSKTPEVGKFYGLEKLVLPLVISAVIFILPLIFTFLAEFEKYPNHQLAVYLDMIRMIVLFIVSLGVLIEHWFSDTYCSMQQAGNNLLGATGGLVSNKTPSVTGRNVMNTINTTNMTNGQDTCPECWENTLGYNLYRFVVVDFLITLIITFFTEFGRKFLAVYVIKKLELPEFNIGRNTLYLIYSQSLIWLAAFYSPILPLLMIVKLVLLFYIKGFSVTANCKPSIKPWRGGRVHTIIMAMLGLALILCFISVGYSIVRLTPSVSCGPFQGKTKSYVVITEFFKEWAEREKTFSTIFQFVTSAGFLAGVILGLIIAAYYARIRAHGLDDTVLALKEQIAMERKDKKFLIKLIQTAGTVTTAKYSRIANRPNLEASPADSDDDEEEGRKRKDGRV